MVLTSQQTTRLARIKAQSDAPNYRRVGSASLQKCATCSHFKSSRYTGHCDLYDFRANPQYTCDDWRPNVEALRTARTKAANFGATAGQTIAGRLARGQAGKFTAGDRSDSGDKPHGVNDVLGEAGITPAEANALNRFAQGGKVTDAEYEQLKGKGLAADTTDGQRGISQQGSKLAKAIKANDPEAARQALAPKQQSGGGKGGKPASRPSKGAGGGGRGSSSSQQTSRAATAALVSLRRGQSIPQTQIERLARLGLIQFVNGRPVVTRQGQRLVGATKEAGSTPTTVYGHGPGGAFSTPGLGGGKKRKKKPKDEEVTLKPGKSPGPSIKNPEVYESLLKKGYSKEQAARISNAMASRTKEHSGVIASFTVPGDVARKIALDTPNAEPPENLHITLAYLGDKADLGEFRQRIETAIRIFAASNTPIRGVVNGGGSFARNEESGKVATWAYFDSPELADFRQRLVNLIRVAAVPFRPTYGFIPHITLAYTEPGQEPKVDLPRIPITFDAVELRWGDEVLRFPMVGATAEKSSTAAARPTSFQSSGGTFRVFKDKSGRHRWIAISSNSYRDRDREIVSQKSLEADVERADKTKEYGPLRFWHMPGVDIGDCDFNMMRGRMLIESGTFKDERIGAKVAQKARDYQLSLGFAHPRDEPDKDGVFHNIRRFERSLVPAGRAANPFTSLAVKEPTMNLQEKIAQFKALLDDDEVASAILANADTAQKQADGMGIAFKEATEAELTAMSPDQLLDYALARKEAAIEAAEKEGGDDDDEEKGGSPFEREMKGYMTKVGDRLSHIEKMLGERHSQKDDTVADTVKSVAEAQDAHGQRITALETAVKERTEALQKALKELQEVTGSQPRAFTEGGQRPTEDPANVTEKEAVIEAQGVANGAVTEKGYDGFLNWLAPNIE